MVLLPVAHSRARRARARKAHVGPLGPLKAKCSSSSSLPLGPLWHSLAPFGMEAKLFTKGPFGPLEKLSVAVIVTYPLELFDSLSNLGPLGTLVG